MKSKIYHYWGRDDKRYKGVIYLYENEKFKTSNVYELVKTPDYPEEQMTEKKNRDTKLYNVFHQKDKSYIDTTKLDPNHLFSDLYLYQEVVCPVVKDIPLEDGWYIIMANQTLFLRYKCGEEAWKRAEREDFKGLEKLHVGPWEYPRHDVIAKLSKVEWI